MMNDELQVLGTPQNEKKRYKWIVGVIVLLMIALAGGFYWGYTLQQPEKIKTGKKIGDPTIVAELQHAVDSLLTDEMTLIGALHGQAIVMEVQTGEIKAMVGLERNYEGKYQACNNFAYQQELGSLIKTASLLAVLETGKMELSDTVCVGNGIMSIGEDLVMKDHNWHRGGYGTITLDRALEVSSNIGIGIAVNKAFGENQQEYFNLLEKMCFGKPDSIKGVEGLRLSSYSSPKDKDWAEWKIWWSAIGYERKITPIQVLTFYNAIANGGKMVKPTLKTGEAEIVNPQIASKKNIDSMQVVLEHVVSQGLGRKAGSTYVQVAGKTGTSQVNEYEFGEDIYLNEYQVAFCGYFPAFEPKYSIIVSMNKLGLPASGGGMAGEVFHQIVEWMMAHEM
ncbi:MAG: penicillin-binding protein [Prevotella sp.]|nr:penicillin-binding protein [Prevotella sp.]